MKKVLIGLVVVVALAALAAVSGFNSLNAQDEQVRSSWAEVLNQFQRGADLVPNLVETVKGIAEQEKEVFQSVTEARARVGEVKIDLEGVDDAALLERFQAAQTGLGSALSRLIAVSESYPEIKSSEAFVGLQTQLEGTENRIAVARNRFIDAVRSYNTTVRSFPSNLVASTFGFNRKPTFTVGDEDALAQPPKVELNN